MIGKKELWGRGYGTETIALLVDFGVRRTNRSTRYSASSPPTTSRSLRAFQKCGFTRHAVIQEEEDGTLSHDLVLTADRHTMLS